MEAARQQIYERINEVFTVIRQCKELGYPITECELTAIKKVDESSPGRNASRCDKKHHLETKRYYMEASYDGHNTGTRLEKRKPNVSDRTVELTSSYRTEQPYLSRSEGYSGQESLVRQRSDDARYTKSRPPSGKGTGVRYDEEPTTYYAQSVRSDRTGPYPRVGEEPTSYYRQSESSQMNYQDPRYGGNQLKRHDESSTYYPSSSESAPARSPNDDQHLNEYRDERGYSNEANEGRYQAWYQDEDPSRFTTTTTAMPTEINEDQARREDDDSHMNM